MCVSFAMDFLVLLPCFLSRCGTPLDMILACGWAGVPLVVLAAVGHDEEAEG